jgi:DNA-binding response OmpR family regulator
MQGTSKPVALIVEDQEDVAALLKFLFEREGYATEVASDGKAALASIARMLPPAVVMLDVMLPYVDGFQVLAKMRIRAGWESLPIIMLTAKSQEKDIVRALDAGASDYIVKPFKLEELRARVRRLRKP